MPVELHITTLGSAMLSVSMVAVPLIIKYAPARKPRVGSYDTHLALLANEISHIKEKVDKIEQRVDVINSKLR